MPPSPLEARFTAALQQQHHQRPVRPQDLGLCPGRKKKSSSLDLIAYISPPGCATMPGTGSKSGPVRSLSCGCSSSACCTALLSYEERARGAVCSDSSSVGGSSSTAGRALHSVDSTESMYPCSGQGRAGGSGLNFGGCAPCQHLNQTLQTVGGGSCRSVGESTFQGDFRSIWPNELARRLMMSEQPGVMLVDCRPFLEYNRVHIQGAVHVNCTDKLSRRRIQQGKVSVLELLSGRGESWRTHGQDVIVYDECGGGEGARPSGQPVGTVLESLRRDGKDPIILKGGFSSFRRQHEKLCTSSLHIPLELQPCQSRFGEPGRSTPDIENAEITSVLPFLFLGNERDAQELSHLQSLNVGYVLNVTVHLPLFHYEHGILRYKRLPATDSSKQNLRQYFEEACEFIEEAHQSGQGLLVHCQAGVSRSATIIIAYLMKHTRMTMADAYTFVKSKRPIISPNLNFMGQLLQFEEDLNSGVSPRILNHRLLGLETVV
uniref:Dual specificity phosphatase 10 n=1 Tax=Eptatretus burgeri TaxID=7764 RepID=A0A8C4NJN2_EPTBU